MNKPDSLKDRILNEFKPINLIPNAIAGIIVSIIVVIVSVSLATLVFSGQLMSHLDIGIGLMLFSGILTTGIVALTSSYPGMIAYPQERVAPILAVIAVYIVESAPPGTTPDTLFFTVVAAITLATLANGVFLFSLGVFRLGALIRFIPYPVIGGFLAGTGWLLTKGSIGVMVGIHLHLKDLPHLFEGEALPKLIAGLVYGMVLVLVTRKYHHYLVLPAILLGGVAVFYIVTLILGISPEAARSDGWLLGPFPDSQAWKPLAHTAFLNADWGAVLAQTGNIGTILLISVVSVLMNSGALELAAKTDIDLNRELKVAGATNILVGLGGGTVGFHSLSISRLVHKMGARSRIVGLIASAVCLIMLIIGAEVMTFFPRYLLAGLLFFLGMHFLIEWVYDAWFKLTRADYFIVILILGCVGVFGYMEGVGVGIIACIILFLVNYSGVNVVKHALSGDTQQSNVDRPGRHFRILQEKGRQLYIFKLQGYIFFGTANSLLDRLRKRLDDPDRPPLKFMNLDFKHVSGIDSSSTISFIKMKQLAEQRNFVLIFTQVPPDIRGQLNREGFETGDATDFRLFVDLDHSLEWCENQILLNEKVDIFEYDAISLRDNLVEEFKDGAKVDVLLSYFDAVEVNEGDVLIKQGDQSDDLFLIEKGQVTARLNLEDDKFIRLRTMCAGTIIGEIGLILNETRSADVVAERPTRLFRLTTESWNKMQENDPKIAVSFYKFLTELLAERLANTTKAMQTLLD